MEYVKCNLCNSKDYRQLFSAGDSNLTKQGMFSVVRCRDCGLVYMNPRLTKESMAQFYPATYYKLEKSESSYLSSILKDKCNIKEMIRSCHKIERLKEKGKILDVGCGRGDFLNYMRARGWETYGVESTEIAARHCREVQGLNVFYGELLEANFHANHFDVVRLGHVLEHVQNPREILQEINRILKPEGLLVISVPNIDSYEAKIFRENWYMLDLPRHLYHFSLKTLKDILEKTKFQIIYFTRNYDLFAFRASLIRKSESLSIFKQMNVK
ncbi:MAG: class I SAM-dependent methyltransferase, partial [Candidatus Woesearchaeota archaeon]